MAAQEAEAAPPAAPAVADANAAPRDIVLRTPSKYLSSSSASSDTTSSSSFAPPPSDWLVRTWAVTHSTLSMWRTAQNVRISYRTLPADAKGRPRNEDRVEYESNKEEGGRKKAVKSVEGVNVLGTSKTEAGDRPDGTFDWRGKSWLFFVTSHWEVLGWGERPLVKADGSEDGVERWVVTWFAPTFFTKEGIDFYSDRSEGLSAETAAALLEAASASWPEPLATLAKGLLPVDIKLPWSE